MKGGSIPAVCHQNHATLRFCEKRSVARSEAGNRQIRGKTTANTAFLAQPKAVPGWAELEGRYTSVSLDTGSVASKCSVELSRCCHVAVEAGARAADDDA
jgi:hypothetical protein